MEELLSRDWDMLIDRHNIRMLSTQYPDIPRSPLPAAVAFDLGSGYPSVDYYGFAAMTISCPAEGVMEKGEKTGKIKSNIVAAGPPGKPACSI